MASCSLGASHIKILKLEYGGVRFSNLQKRNITRTWISRSPLQYAGLVTSRPSEKAFTVCCGSTLGTESSTNLVGDSKGRKSSGLTSQLIPNSSEVEYLVSEICNSTSIAEFELKLDGFRLYVLRDLASKTSVPPPPPSPAPISLNTAPEAPDLNGSVSTSSLAITKPVPSTGGIQMFLGKAADEGLMIIQSPRVGFFRRSRTIKGKRAPPSCKEKQEVKEGQVLCYIEQLGGEIPIESDVSGEVIRILRDDGDPVGYGDALITILPSFPGIKKLQ
ncbi:Biotin_lipoyl domain-containing protein [Cephalotus follicularis]|uniref:Biotin_lipoyl domain-containing protein n=1 Tax=Cephalotus follicularis TaxID=3775 RepID=A0A1Q3BDA2_CEPFO|nr:Biotin_lipoyl domain-containing protein [Cephalotus follicularis]